MLSDIIIIRDAKFKMQLVLLRKKTIPEIYVYDSSLVYCDLKLTKS